VAKTAKSTRGQTISILEIYLEDIADTLLPGDFELLKEKYGEDPCQYEVRYPWKDPVHYTWFVEDVYEKYSKTHKIVRRKR
jgi:hypothetical protein